MGMRSVIILTQHGVQQGMFSLFLAIMCLTTPSQFHKNSMLILKFLRFYEGELTCTKFIAGWTGVPTIYIQPTV